MPLYDAFISYSHAKDKPVATALQSVIQSLGKPWYTRRALRVFRDDTSLAAAPQLWPAIERALEESRFFLLLASPEAAASVWVGKEVAHWIERRGIDTVLIGVTGGATPMWDGTAGDFRTAADTPLPPALRSRFPSEPKWVDLRPFRGNPRTRDHRFMDAAADFAAAIQGRPKEDLLSREVMQQRRALTLAWSAAAALTVLMLAAVWQWREAVAQRDRAENTLAAATQSANDFILKIAVRIRQTVGVPIDLARDILRRAEDLQEQLVKYNEAEPALRRSRALALRETSQTLLAQGDADSALDAALRSRAIMDALIAAQPDDAELQRELALSLNRIGEAHARAGRHEEALNAFQASLAIRKAQADAESDADRKRELALSYERVGDELFSLQLRDEATDAYQTCFDLREELTQAAPDNLIFQGDLAVAYDRLGRLADGERALALYRKGEAIRERLVEAEPKNAIWQRDLAVSFDTIGDLLRRSGAADALDAYRRALAIRERLAAGDLDNPSWQRLLVISLVKLAEAGDDPLGRYQRALAIVVKLDETDRLSGRERGWRRDLESRIARMKT